MANKTCLDGERERLLSRQMKHAPFFRIKGDNVATEQSVFDSWWLAVGKLTYPNGKSVAHRSNNEDPPDVVLALDDSSTVGFEITELVDEKGRRAAGSRRSEPYIYMDFTPDDLRSHVRNLITKKAKNPFKGGPYVDKVLILHTDEPTLSRELIERTDLHFSPEEACFFDSIWLMRSSEVKRERTCDDQFIPCLVFPITIK